MGHDARTLGWLVATGMTLAAGGIFLTKSHYADGAPLPAQRALDPREASLPNGANGGANDGADDGHDEDRTFVFRIPSGEPTSLTCEEARTIVDQVRAGLAYTPEAIEIGAFATSTADWLDPHGLLSLAKDAPTTREITKWAREITADLEGRRQRSCASAKGPAAVLETWTAELRAAFERGRKSYAGVDPSSAALDPIPPTGIARETAEELGRRIGSFEAKYGADAKPYTDDAARRFFPPLDQAGWARVVLASAVRAYVPLVDPHGEWAPFDEESRIYEVDLAARPPSRLWGRAVPTAVGVRITDSATPPFAVDDIVLSVARVTTAGLPLEQIDQLGFASSDAKTPLAAVVLRNGRFLALEVGKPDEPAPVSRAPAATLPSSRVAFGEGDVLVVTIKEVRDELGDELAALIVQERDRGPRKVSGLVLDLRGNGGGSTDGAIGALSLFLPGAPVVAMKRRDGTVEIDQTPIPREHETWKGPVATFVNATTASAAEMIAGALAAYRRGPSVGTTTFGKGCAQEYVDDDAHTGVLRLTTLVYALPDGSPVQKVGLTPQLRFPFSVDASDNGAEREARLPHSAPSWRGPDLRTTAAIRVEEKESAWPSHGGNVGPCDDAETCRALRLLGAPKRAAVAKH